VKFIIIRQNKGSIFTILVFSFPLGIEKSTSEKSCLPNWKTAFYGTKGTISFLGVWLK